MFDNTADQPYTLPLDREYYINNRGANYVVKRTDTSTYDAKIEIQTVANPVNAATFLQANTTFRPQWTDTGNSTYQFITTSADPNFLKLVYATVGTNDPPKPELFAAPGPRTPRTSPAPNRRLSEELCTAWAYAIH